MRGTVGTAGCVAALLGMVALVSGCGRDDAPLADELARYTDRGDGCQQVVSAISYASAQLKPEGQERYQVWDDAVRSSIAAVAGTIALEVRDFPSAQVLEQARTVERLADRTAAARTHGERRIRLFRQYRREAMQLVLDCSREVPTL